MTTNLYEFASVAHDLREEIDRLRKDKEILYKALEHYINPPALYGRSPFMDVLLKPELKDHHSSKWRKERPLATGVLDYFPDALMEVAHCSFVGNKQHSPSKPLQWDKSKSTDEADALLRHLKDRGKRDIDGVRHSTKVAWRALANLQREIEEQ